MNSEITIAPMPTAPSTVCGSMPFVHAQSERKRGWWMRWWR
jgi:hypothetical protein